MSSKVETIGRISEDGISKIQKVLLSETECGKDWLSLIGLSLSSYFDVAVAYRGSVALVMSPKFIQSNNSQSDLSGQNMTHFFPSDQINSLYGPFTCCDILPVISTKRSDCGQPETTILCFGTEAGNVLFYMANGTLLLEQLFHRGPVQNINFRGFSRHQPNAVLTIVYDSCTVEINGFELHQTLRVARVNPSNQMEKPSLKSTKRLLAPGSNRSVSSIGTFTLTRYDQYFNASFAGENESVSSRLPSYNSFVSGGCADESFLSYYHHIDQIDQSAISSALNVGKGLLKKTTGWFWGGSNEQEKEEVQIDPGIAMDIRAKLRDRNRKVIDICQAPYGLSLAAASDSLGRVHIIETNQMTILRVIKGQRDARIGWITSSNESRTALFLVILDRLGTCSVISSVYGPRVALWNFGKGSMLLKETNQIGITPQNLKSVAQSHYQIAVMNSDCEIKRIYVPLHLALNDQNSPRLADLATFKELSQELRVPEPNENEIEKLLDKLRLTTTQRQSLEKIISSEKISLDKIKSYIALFDGKLEGSSEKDKKEFIFWLEKLKKVISIFEIFIDQTVPDEHVVDFLSLFPTNQRDGIQTIFALCKTLNQLATSKVKFAVSSKSKSLYDFSRCFVEENGTFKLHKSISSTRKGSLAINLFNSNNLEEITNSLVLSLDDYMELLFTYIQNVNTNSDLAAKFIRLLTVTKKIYGVQLGDDWAENIREKLKSISNPNGLLFTAVLIYYTKQDNKSANNKSADGDDTLDWFDLVNTDTWLESMEQQYLTTALYPICQNMGDNFGTKIESISANLLISYGSGCVTELVADWYISWFLTDQSSPSDNPKVAEIQIYIQDFLLKLFPQSLNTDLLVTSLFWTSISAWASSTKSIQSEKLIRIVLDTLQRLKEPHLSSGIVAFVWKTLLAKKFESVMIDLAEKKKTKLGLAKSSKRTESPAKIDQVMELIGALMDILLAVDIDETPQPDITNELTHITNGGTKKPSICEIALNQPVANPALIRLHQQLLTCLRLSNSLKIQFSNNSLFDENQTKQFFKSLDRIYQENFVSSKTLSKRYSFVSDSLAAICCQASKGKLADQHVYVYYNEVRRLAIEWEFDLEIQVDIPFIVNCIRFNVDVPSSIHVQDVQKLSEDIGGVLANSTRDLIGSLSGESAAKFLADLAPFNINGWLNNDNELKIVSKIEPNRLLQITDYMVGLEPNETMIDNLGSIKRALSNLAGEPS